MKKCLILLPILLAACDSRVEELEELCKAATHGLANQDGSVQRTCVRETYVAGWQAEHDAAQKFRNKPR